MKNFVFRIYFILSKIQNSCEIIYLEVAIDPGGAGGWGQLLQE